MTATSTAVGVDTALGIVVGLLPPGTPLPDVDELAHRTGARRVEVVEGLERLAARRAVEHVPGDGILVTGRIVHRVDPGHPVSLLGSMRSSGRLGRRHPVHHEVLDAAVLDTPTEAADRLGTSRVVVITRRTWLADRPVAWCRSWLGADDVPGVVDATGTGSLHQTLAERYGLHPVRATTDVDLEIPPVAVARALHVDGRPRAWWLRGLDVRPDDGHPVHVSETWLRLDTFRVPLPR